MASAPETKKNQQHDPVLDEVVTTVKTGLGLFTLAIKNFALYPKTNLIRQQSLLAFHTWLESFLEDFDGLHLDVEKDRLLLASETVYQDKPNEQSLVYPFFRDGIQWFKFTENVTPDEIGEFINLFNLFRILKEEASDDLATALWEANFPHIAHKTTDDFWETDPMADIAAIKKISEDSNDPESIARIGSDSNTVAYVLRALAKNKETDDKSDTEGPTQIMHVHPIANDGEEGVDASIAMLESILNCSDEGEYDPVTADPNSGEEAAGAENYTSFPSRSGGKDPRTIFLETLSTENDSMDKENRKSISGAITLDSGTKPRVNDGPVVVEKNSSHGSRLTPSYCVDDDDEDVTATDTAAKSSFKSPSYFENKNSEYIWPLAPNEELRLKELIATEANRNLTKDCLETTMILLNHPGNQPESPFILDFLAEEVRYALSQGDFHFIRAFIEDLEKRAVHGHEPFTQIATELNQKIISPETLGILSQSWDDHKLSDELLAELRCLLLLLPPEAIHTLVPLLTGTCNRLIEKILLGVVAIEACQITANVVPLISTLKISSILELIRIFRSQDTGPACPAALLVGLSRNESSHVREEAARTLIEQQPESVKNLFHLIDDPDQAVNTVICMHLARQRSPLAEKVLLDYLSTAYHEKKNQANEQTLNCYWAFGNCASAQSIPFLREILLKKDWQTLLGFSGHCHRQGAAMALMLMPAEWGGQEILETARRSYFKNIRQACQSAEESLMDYRRTAGEY